MLQVGRGTGGWRQIVHSTRIVVPKGVSKADGEGREIRYGWVTAVENRVLCDKVAINRWATHAHGLEGGTTIAASIVIRDDGVQVGRGVVGRFGRNQISWVNRHATAGDDVLIGWDELVPHLIPRAAIPPRRENPSARDLLRTPGLRNPITAV